MNFLCHGYNISVKFGFLSVNFKMNEKVDKIGVPMFMESGMIKRKSTRHPQWRNKWDL